MRKQRQKKSLTVSHKRGEVITTMHLQVATAVRLLAKEGLIELHGHVSCRSPEGENVLILGHIHDGDKLPKDVTDEDIVEINQEGKTVKGKFDPPEEYPIHTEIYRAKPWIKAVVHAHPRQCLALSIVGKNILPVWNKGRYFAPQVPLWRNSEHIDSAEKGRRMVAEMGSSYVLSLQGHGIVAMGTSIEEATVLALLAEETAALQILIAGMGEIETVKNFSKVRAHSEHELLRPIFAKAMWQYYLEK